MAGTGDTEMKPWTSGSQGQVGQPQTGKQPKSQMSNKDIRSSFRVWENRCLSALYHGDARKPLPLLCITKPPHHRNSSRWGRNVAGAELPWSTWRSGGEVFLPFLPPPKVGSAPPQGRGGGSHHSDSQGEGLREETGAAERDLPESRAVPGGLWDSRPALHSSARPSQVLSALLVSHVDVC